MDVALLEQMLLGALLALSVAILAPLSLTLPQ